MGTSSSTSEATSNLRKKDINTSQAKAWTAIGRLLIIWKSEISDKIKGSFFLIGKKRLLFHLISLCGRVSTDLWMHHMNPDKAYGKKLDSNCTRMLWDVLNKSWRPHLLYISKTIHSQAKHAGYCWKSKDELISDILRWNPSHGRARLGRPARIYLQKLCTDAGCSMEDDRDEWQNRVKEISISGTP